jgi:agmatine deiminase
LYVGAMPIVMPAEWEEHARCYMSWSGRDLVSTKLHTNAKRERGLIARTLAGFEPVTMLVHPGFAAEAAAYCGPDVELLEVPLGDGWLRDSGPLFALRDGEVVAVDFAFNSWGQQLPAYRGSVGDRLCRRRGIPRVTVPLVLEGGAIAVDGAGALIALAPSILTDNRNPGVARAEFETAFRDYLGVERAVWLPEGLPDDETDGHADNVVAFVAPGRVLCQQVGRNRRILQEAGLEVVEFDLPTTPVRYLNFYVGNGCVLVPQAGAASDREALARIREHFPGREVLGVPGAVLAEGGGGVHCITQPEPCPRASPGAP